MNHLAELLARWCLQNKYWVIALSLLLVLVAGSGVTQLRFNDDYRSFFSQHDPYKQAYEAVEHVYSDNDFLLFVVTPVGGDVFTPKVLAALEELTAASWQLPYVLRVDSVTNYQYSYAQGDDIIVENLIENAQTLSPEYITARRAEALTEPPLVRRLISPDGRVTAVSLTIQGQENRSREQYELSLAARELAAAFRERYAFLDIRVTGNMMLPIAMREASQQDMRTLFPLMMLTIILVVQLLLRSWVATAGVIVVVGLSTITALGLSGWVGLQLSAVSTAAPSIIMTLAVADCIHILAGMMSKLREGASRDTAITGSLQANFLPIFLTSLTTVIGLLVFNFNESPQLQALGNITAFGIVAAWLLAILFLPAFLACFSFPERKDKSLPMANMIAWIADKVVVYQRQLLLGVGLMNIVILSLIGQNQANDQFVRYFLPGTEFRDNADYVVENLSGLYQFIYSMPAGESDGISQPAYLNQLEQFANWLREQPEVMHVDSITDVFKQMNQNMHQGDEAFYQVPQQKKLAAQYLLFYEFSLPFGLDLNSRINIDKSSTRLVVTLTELDSVEVRAAERRYADWLKEYAPELNVRPVGPAIMFSHISERTIKSMILGTLVGMVLIAVVLMVALRSVKYGLISLLPNILPAALAFGVWGGMVGQVNMAVSVVVAMTLGIVVDDTVHFLSKYLQARRITGKSSTDAVKYAFSSVGMALTTTSVALVLGFSLLTLSQILLNVHLASMTAIAILLALVVDFLFLPPILMKLDK